MKKSFFIAIIFLLNVSTISTQNTDKNNIVPILLDKSALSGVGLKKVVIKDEPEKDFYQKKLFGGDDISVYVVSTETWNNKFDNFWFDEFIYMFHGEAIIKPTHGQSQLFYSGDYFFAPKGYTGEWEIKAGQNLHYELSVITTKRADSTLVSNNLSHTLFDKSKLSGAHIPLDEKESYSELLRKGVELTVSLHAEKPTKKTDLELNNDQLVHILSGQIVFSDTNNSKHTFYSGDFFILPKGCKGTWHSEGHSLIKYLSVEKTK